MVASIASRSELTARALLSLGGADAATSLLAASLSLHSLTGPSHASSGSRDDALRSHALGPASGACLLLSALASAPGGGDALLESNAAVSLGEAVARRGLPVALRAAAANALGEAVARSTQKCGAAAVEAAAGRALRALAAAEGADGEAARAAVEALDAAAHR